MRKDCTVVTFGVSQGVGGLWKSSAKVSERALDNFTTYQTGKASGWCTHWLLTFRPIKSSQYIEINIDHLWPSQVLLIYFVLHLLFYNLKLNEHCIVPLCKGNYQCSQGTLVIPLPRFVPRGKDIQCGVPKHLPQTGPVLALSHTGTLWIRCRVGGRHLETMLFSFWLPGSDWPLSDR